MRLKNNILVVGKPSSLQAFMDNCKKVDNKITFLLTPEQYTPYLPLPQMEPVLNLAILLQKGEGVEDVAYFREAGITRAQEALDVLYAMFPNLPKLLDGLATAPENVYNMWQLEMQVHGMAIDAEWTETSAECAAYLEVICTSRPSDSDDENILPERWLGKLQTISSAYPELAFQIEMESHPGCSSAGRLVWAHNGTVTDESTLLTRQGSWRKNLRSCCKTEELTRECCGRIASQSERRRRPAMQAAPGRAARRSPCRSIAYSGLCSLAEPAHFYPKGHQFTSPDLGDGAFLAPFEVNQNFLAALLQTKTPRDYLGAQSIIKAHNVNAIDS
jgi:hypothetical protein